MEYGEAAKHLESLTYADNDKEMWALRNLMIADYVRSSEEFETWWAEEMQDKYGREYNPTKEQALLILEELNALRNNIHGFGIDHLSKLAMSLSLCPIHFLDWAICFDDEPASCEQVRNIFPFSHDT